LLAIFVLTMTACAKPRHLMPTPDIYDGNNSTGLETLNQPLRTNSIDLLYVTDRKPEINEANDFGYGHLRSLSMAFGSVTVIPGPAMNWNQLVAASETANRSREVELHIGDIAEQGRYPETPFPLVEGEEGMIKEDPASHILFDVANNNFQEELNRRLAIAPKKEVFIYIHGYNNSFAVAAYTLAELWHFSGRESVPILYSWPAGRGGASGYGYDRESGEFTIFHLKQLLRTLASKPEIEKIHILAHSRGTDVISTALRELFIEARASGKDPRSLYRIVNLILAAPDIDVEVMSQRMIAERLGFSVGRTTIYTSSQDKAIRLSELLFGSISRVGRLVSINQDQELVPDQDQIKIQDISRVIEQQMIKNNLSFIEVQGESNFFGHNYFHSNPAVSSDLIMLLRYEAPPGKEHGRPIKPIGPNIWVISDDTYK